MCGGAQVTGVAGWEHRGGRRGGTGGGAEGWGRLCPFRKSNISYPDLLVFSEKRHFEVTLILCSRVYPSTVKYHYFVGMIFVLEELGTLSTLRS